ncbi:uncharacterized protein [Arachis hypogaea]|uniref:uncharacterized protein isoform X4 n=1 Tax=Arachis hypogaea TaxID=3818 RepID=UPI000A2C1AAB|nr:uncharacterized protein LOC112706089 isoform X4 [Arachis hypogaea]
MEPASSTSPCRMTVVKSRSRPRLLLPRSLSRSLTKTRSRSTPLIRFCFRGSFSRPWLRLLRPRPHRSQPPWTLLHPRRKRERRRSRRQPTRRQMRNQRLRIRPVMPPMTALTTVTALLGLTTSGTGGEWCNDVSTCLQRKDTRLGSSKQMDTQSGFNGILNNQQVYNPGWYIQSYTTHIQIHIVLCYVMHLFPDFYNWNRIKIRYCNGSSFTGDVEEVDLTTNLHFRGARIFEAVIKHLLAKGMENAKNGILSGCSAGGLAAILNYDRFKSFLPNGARVKCVPDAGYFIHMDQQSICLSPALQNMVLAWFCWGYGCRKIQPRFAGMVPVQWGVYVYKEETSMKGICFSGSQQFGLENIPRSPGSLTKKRLSSAEDMLQYNELTSVGGTWALIHCS